MGRIRKMLGVLMHGSERLDVLADRIDAVNRRVDSAGETLQAQAGEIRSVANADQPFVHQLVARLCGNRDEMKLLKKELSICPAVWGDPDRLEIAETASVYPCFFNTNSGSIRIGDYTFAGSGVSLLAGSHDKRLTGLARKDAEPTEGCDITVGKGVWLCSGCTLLGPCTIGDNAVIAAGAVVAPGTEIPANTIWGGIPAKQIGRTGTENGPDDGALREAMVRNGGLLYLDGWGEKTPGVFESAAHRLLKEEGTVLTDRADWNLAYAQDGESGSLRVTGPDGGVTLELPDRKGSLPVHLPIKDGEPGEIRFRREPGSGQPWICLEKLRESDEKDGGGTDE